MLDRNLVLRRASPATSSLGATTSTRMRRRRPRVDYKASKERNPFLPMRFLRGIQIHIFELGTGIRPCKLRSQYSAGPQSRGEVVSNILFVVAVGSGDAR